MVDSSSLSRIIFKVRGFLMHWLDFETTTAPNPVKDGEPLRVAMSPELIRMSGNILRATPVYQLWCHVMGKLPPINNIAKVESSEPKPTLTTLHDAVACFGGLQRPHDDEFDGRSVLVYVLTPTISLEYIPSMVCLARAFRVPTNTVFTVQVRPHFALQQEMDGIHGLVTRIEPVFGTPETPHLPAKHDSRYGERFW